MSWNLKVQLESNNTHKRFVVKMYNKQGKTRKKRFNGNILHHAEYMAPSRPRSCTICGLYCPETDIPSRSMIQSSFRSESVKAWISAQVVVLPEKATFKKALKTLITSVMRTLCSSCFWDFMMRTIAASTSCLRSSSTWKEYCNSYGWGHTLFWISFLSGSV